MKVATFRGLATVILPLTLCCVARGDVTGTPTLTSGQQFNITTGTVVTSGGDFQWTGSEINFLGAAKAFILSGNQTSSYPGFTITEAQLDASSMTQSSVSPPTVGTMFLMQANSGSFAKVLITAQSGTSITFEFDTFPTPVPITYTLTGFVQGNVNGQNFNAAFSWVALASTGGITNPSAGQYQNQASSSYLTINGVLTREPIQNVQVQLNANTGAVTFTVFLRPVNGVVVISGPQAALGINGIAASQFTSNLSTVIGPVAGTSTFGQGSMTTASGTTINITGATVPASAASPTFQASTAPYIWDIQNAASNTVGGTTTAQLAQGAIIVLKGNGLGPANTAIASTPFQSTTLSNTSAAVTVGSTTINLPLYYTSAGQVAALLPSNTPTGTGSFTVTYNGQTGPATNHTIVSNNLGIFSIDSSGTGPAIVTYGDYSLVSAAKMPGCIGPGTTPEPYEYCGAANPNDTLILWATGLGPVNGDDVAGVGLGVAQPNVPLTLWLGGVQAPITYQGRSGCCVGEDQIVFTVPANVPLGCAVPLVAQIGSGSTAEISNTTLLPVASGSRNCTPANPAQASENLEQTILSGTLPLNHAELTLARNSTSGSGFVDQANFEFGQVLSFIQGSTPFFATYTDDQPTGTCVVYNNLIQGPTVPIGFQGTADAGSSVTITGPGGSLQESVIPGQNNLTLSATGSFLTPGTFTVSNGTGGSDIGAFKASVTVPGALTLTSPTTASVSSGVTRANGLTVTWTGGAANNVVQISITSSTDVSFTNGSSLSCWAAASAGTFMIPPYALEALNASNFSGISVWENSAEVPFTATGLAYGQLQYSGPSTFVGFALK